LVLKKIQCVTVEKTDTLEHSQLYCESGETGSQDSWSYEPSIKPSPMFFCTSLFSLAAALLLAVCRLHIPRPPHHLASAVAAFSTAATTTTTKQQQPARLALNRENSPSLWAFYGVIFGR